VREHRRGACCVWPISTSVLKNFRLLFKHLPYLDFQLFLSEHIPYSKSLSND